MALGEGDGSIGVGQEEMVASYQIEITGIERTKSELAKLSRAIISLRNANYKSGHGGKGITTVSRSGGNTDVFATKIDALEGRVQTQAVKMMDSGVKLGKQVQGYILDAAQTKTGLSGKPTGRKSAGRNVTGDMIKGVDTNVEVQKSKNKTTITGWHGWKKDRDGYFIMQEKGTRGKNATSSVSDKRASIRKSGGNGGVPAANSLGGAILVVREDLKKNLGSLKR